MNDIKYVRVRRTRKLKIAPFWGILMVMIAFISCLDRVASNKIEKKDNIVLAYVTSYGNTLPDPQIVTHINYAFGHIDSSFCQIVIENEKRLSEISALKRKHPHLKVLLSVGGWGSGGFSEMAADEQKRLSFAEDCHRIIEQFGIDGIDIDWEYPTSSAAGISSSLDDTYNYTFLMRDIRKAIGKNKLLTLASVYNGNYIDFRAIDSFIDFVNVMVYDINRPPYHHAALYRSERSGNGTVEEAINAHLQKGIMADKLVLGIPFYGHGVAPLPDFINYDVISELEGYVSCWDSIAQVPYLADQEENLICSFENPMSIAAKCSFVKEKGLLGIMYWEYNTDDKNGTLRNAVYKGMK
ncbi:glycosyl hydrolase family 18 protein [uncultured Parabacteroides sp.]|uniref:glycoside hydrolase family 18 protein n=1 Tax=uncultured Parabacteroides sp. TaxID=512312 RepID=UPI0028062A96|nr:glycosyl hydrolase family 18 protein [uncultured Parabacteroides sp.]